MLQILPSDESVIAVRVGGRLERSEIETLLDRLEARLTKDERTHLFVEVEDGKGLEVEGLRGLGDSVRRAGGLLGKLKHLGRVAIVSDRRWVRGAAMLESAVLPRVRYEIFRSTERSRALAWVRGERELPRSAFKIIETSRPDVLGFQIDGKISAEELAAAADVFNGLIVQRRPLRVLGRVTRFGGVELAGLADRDFIAMKRGIVHYLERYALVGGPGWLRAWVSAVDAIVEKVDLRHFDASEEARAWEWLGATIRSERPILERAAAHEGAPQVEQRE